MGIKERALKAFRATRNLGIPDKEVKPLLHDLLELYDWNWEPIEAEDYRALIDAYFESKENKGVEDEKVGIMEQDRSEGPSRKLKREGQGDHTPSVMANSTQTLALEKAEILLNSDRAHCSEPLKVVPPAVLGSLVSTPTRNLCVKPVVSRGVHIDNEDNASGCSGNKSSSNPLNVASSASGEVNLSLNCISALANANFQFPNFDAVLENLESRYRTEKMVSSQFSVRKLLNDLCDSYLELGKPTGGSVTNSFSPEVVRPGGISLSTGRLKKRTSSIGNSERDLNKKGKNCSGRTVTSDQKRLVHSISDITKEYRTRIVVQAVQETVSHRQYHVLVHVKLVESLLTPDKAW